MNGVRRMALGVARAAEVIQGGEWVAEGGAHKRYERSQRRPGSVT